MFHAHLNGKPSAIDDYFEGEAIEKIRKKQVRVNDGKYDYISEQLCRQTDNIKIGATFYLKTPLGMVSITKKSGNELMVHSGSWSDYGSIVDYLKTYGFYNEKTVKQIYNYLCLLKDSNRFEVVTTLCKEKPPKNEAGLAYLCAILILAEPYRFRDDGKYVRGQLRKIYNDFQKKISSPFKKAFGSKKASIEPTTLFAKKGGKQTVLSLLKGDTNPELNEPKELIKELNPFISDDKSSDKDS